MMSAKRAPARPGAGDEPAAPARPPASQKAPRAAAIAGILLFIMVVSTLVLRTRFLARWIAFLGYVIALMLIFNSRYVEWMLLSFPLWVLLVSLYILWDNLHVHPAP